MATTMCRTTQKSRSGDPAEPASRPCSRWALARSGATGGLEDGINAVRRTLPLCVFHPRCEPRLAALEQYQREWDDDKKAFKLNPLHNWTSHFADAVPIPGSGLEAGPKRVIKVPNRLALRSHRRLPRHDAGSGYDAGS